ncbi:MAG: RecQ family ATP-dependent DNA helicase, partial [Pseudomonadota bacterium]
MLDDAPHVLKEVFGFPAFRPGQAEVVDALIAGENLLAVMPTGAGKSLCYQIPAILSDRPTVVVSPLVALIDDQVAGLAAFGVAAARIHSNRDRADNVADWRRLQAGEAKIVYMSPERLMTDRMLAALDELKPGLFVVDEAHCVSKWGVAFRPDYAELAILADRFPDATIAGFTATADKATRNDVAEKLFRGRGRILLRGFDRPNLRLAAKPREDGQRQLLDFVQAHAGESGVIYCLSRKSTEKTAAALAAAGVKAIAYHAGLDPDRRREAQDRFMTEDGVAMVATIAFGMGIDKPDIRYVAHLDLPGSPEAYYQEIGRAGRDGGPAETLLLYGGEDVVLRRRMIEDGGGDDDHRRREHARLDALFAFAEASGCRRRALLSYFDEETEACGNCDNCLAPPKLEDAAAELTLLLQAMRQTGGFFGKAHLIDVLRGADTEKIRAKGHDAVDAYGAGAARSKRWWMGLVNQAMADGRMAVEIDGFGGLRATPRGEAVARGEDAFAIRVQAPAIARPSRERRAPALDGVDAGLLSALKARRLELARAAGAPAYVVFPDATLIEMA